MKRMLINATQPEELRVAIVNGQRLDDLDIEVQSREQKKANIYKGRITRVEPSLEACFVDYGADRHGFLPIREVHTSYYKNKPKDQDNVPIAEALSEGQELLVQVEKEERGNKGAALTTFISLASRYLVLMPNNQRGGGVSRQITGVDRKELKTFMRQLNIPEGMGLIARTSGVGRELEELQWDCDYLMMLWAAIQHASEEHKAPHLIYQESSLIIRALRDYLRSDIGEILIDEKSVYDDAVQFMQQVMPHNLGKLKFYDNDTPLFSRFQIESQIESAYGREVRLISGGSIVLDKTEALISIDINSARATKGSDIEDTALNTNLEAADEIARQLRIRDLGGLVVVDFIDMLDRDNQRKVEDRLIKALARDKARTQVGKISRFGLLEMSRQRLRPSLEESTQNVCPRCDGHGYIRSVESLALSVLRLLEEEVMKESTGEVIAKVPNSVGNFLLNEKRHAIAQIEVRHRVPILIINSPHIETPHFEIERIRRADLRIDSDASYELVEAPQIEIPSHHLGQQQAIEKPAVSNLAPARPAPAPVKSTTNSAGLFGWMKSLFSSDKSEEKSKPARKSRSGAKPQARKQSTAKPRQGQAKRGQSDAQKSARGSHSNHPSQRRNKRQQKDGDKQPTDGRGKAAAGNRSQKDQSRSSRQKQQPKQRNQKTAATEKKGQNTQVSGNKQNADGNQKPRRSRSRRRPKSSKPKQDAATNAVTDKAQQNAATQKTETGQDTTANAKSRIADNTSSSKPAESRTSTPRKSGEKKKSDSKPAAEKESPRKNPAGSDNRQDKAQVSRSETDTNQKPAANDKAADKPAREKPSEKATVKTSDSKPSARQVTGKTDEKQKAVTPEKPVKDKASATTASTDSDRKMATAAKEKPAPAPGKKKAAATVDKPVKSTQAKKATDKSEIKVTESSSAGEQTKPVDKPKAKTREKAAQPAKSSKAEQPAKPGKAEQQKPTGLYELKPASKEPAKAGESANQGKAD